MPTTLPGSADSQTVNSYVLVQDPAGKVKGAMQWVYLGPAKARVLPKSGNP